MTGPLVSVDTLYITLTDELPAFLSQSLLQCKSLPTLPSVALKVLDIARSSSSTLSDYAKAIEHDPALTLRLIALANSAYYTRSAPPVQTCIEAMQRLGINATLPVILGFSLFQEAPNRHQAWQRTITAALVARYLAEQLCPDESGSIFTQALLQDIGILALQAAYPEEADKLYTDTSLSHAEITQAEQRCFGCDHTLVGAWLASKWGMSNHAAMAIRQSHESFLVSDKALLCLRLSGPIADAWLSNNPASQLAALLYQLKTVSYADTLQLDEVLYNVQHQTSLIANVMNMNTPIEVDSTALLAEAHQLLFQHTLTLGSQLEAQKQALISLRYPNDNTSPKERIRRDASLDAKRSGLVRKHKK
ncbi:HDOD domain-containing protein [Halomonas sp. 86]|uniref:HDOD domain-containing protein n=1 Tax=unclassified Halomonas TaxID=2609666 RepID=UPI004034B2C5